MAFYDKFPYTNFQELNLDWIVKKMHELDEKYGTGFPTYVAKFINANLNRFLIGSLYSEQEELISLSTPIQAFDAEHYYNVAQQMIIVDDSAEVGDSDGI